MSEAMSSVEIEDVLSSIRRLVSEDLRPAGRAAAASKKPDDKLILTPALRVVAESEEGPLSLGAADRVVAAAPAAEPGTARTTPLPRLHLGAEPVIEELVATLERAVEAQDIEWESEVGDPAPIVADMEWTETGWVALDTVVPQPVSTRAAEPAVAAPPAPPPSWAQTDPEEGDAVAELDGDLLAREPAIAEPDEYWADQAEAEAVAEIRAAKAEEAGPAPEFTFDEDVLRDLVRDLIREELQGGLGERITRNVRKLVRSEIARAMTAQEID